MESVAQMKELPKTLVWLRFFGHYDMRIGGDRRGSSARRRPGRDDRAPWGGRVSKQTTRTGDPAPTSSVAGTWRPGRTPSTALVDPSTGEEYLEAPVSRAEDVDAAMAAAAAAFPGWRDATPSERSLALFRIADAIEARAEELVAVESENTGKPMAVTLAEEIPPMVDQIRFFAGAARHLEGKSAGEYMADHTSMIRREPIGVCAAVTPWNYPMMMAVWKWAPAIAAGNAMVLKPSDTTPASTAPDGRDHVRVPARRCLQRGLRRPRDRPAAGRAPDPGHGVDHRERPGGHGGGRSPRPHDVKRVHLELGRQGAGGRLRRRRPRRPPPRASPSPGTSTPARTAPRPPGCSPAPGIYDDFVAALAEQARAQTVGRYRRRGRRLRPAQQRRPARPADAGSSTACPPTPRW